ncbi:hypothetical protein AOQ84DRAFT_339305 [Glonium stellatum]|uniref:Tat pathway signal sequence n=1 Tax=Glonium stellatum TaxID=574774 RepID=A0A8E2F263_9PEZI|nr:hypothetical protein AOQ84DRAFT_339305 [Glonium stellatum]
MPSPANEEGTERLLAKDHFDDISDNEIGQSRHHTPQALSRTKLPTSFGTKLSVSVNVLFFLCILFLLRMRSSQNAPFTQVLYSPAQSAIQYETVLFNEGSETRGVQSEYIGISDSADAAWEEIDFVILRIDKQSATKLTHPTLGIPGDTGSYVVTLDVFHQLHCLNMIRKSLFPEKYHYWDGENPELEMTHKVHCVEQLRQSLMCSSDITPIPWRWVDEAQESFPSSVTSHTCRNFSNIHEWAKEHALPGGWLAFDAKTKIEY